MEDDGISVLQLQVPGGVVRLVADDDPDQPGLRVFGVRQRELGRFAFSEGFGAGRSPKGGLQILLGLRQEPDVRILHFVPEGDADSGDILHAVVGRNVQGIHAKNQEDGEKSVRYCQILNRKRSPGVYAKPPKGKKTAADLATVFSLSSYRCLFGFAGNKSAPVVLKINPKRPGQI